MKLKFKLLLLIISILFSSCHTDKTRSNTHDNQKNLELLWSYIFWDSEYIYEEDLSYRYVMDTNSFNNQSSMYIDSLQWDLLVKEVDNLTLDSIETNKPYLKQNHNYCVNFQMNFRMNDSVICRICINPEHNRIKKENKIYYTTTAIKDFLKSCTISDTVERSLGKHFSRRLVLVQ